MQGSANCFTNPINNNRNAGFTYTMHLSVYVIASYSHSIRYLPVKESKAQLRRAFSSRRKTRRKKDATQSLYLSPDMRYLGW